MATSSAGPGGNNNTYCQDNDLSWFSWHLQPWQNDLLETTRYLTRCAATTRCCGSAVLHRAPQHADGSTDPGLLSATRTAT